MNIIGYCNFCAPGCISVPDPSKFRLKEMVCTDCLQKWMLKEYVYKVNPNARGE